MRSAPQPQAVEVEQPADVKITDEAFPELSTLVDEALGEIEAERPVRGPEAWRATAPSRSISSAPDSTSRSKPSRMRPMTNTNAIPVS